VATRYCKGCQTIVTGTWWCAACKAARGKSTKDHSRYGGAHQHKRRTERDLAYGKPCARCGRQLEVGQPIHLDHDERGGYLGFSHSTCNLSAGGRKGRAIQTGRRVANATAVHLDASTATIELPPPPERCPECGRAACRRPSGLVSRCW
jgi:hypothetical protein